MNLVVLRGVLAGPVVERELASGDRIATLTVTTREPGAQATSVAVVVAVAKPAQPLASGAWREGDEVVVVGSVQRRFFRTAGVTQSRTEVIAERVIPARRGRRLSQLLEEAAARLVG